METRRRRSIPPQKAIAAIMGPEGTETLPEDKPALPRSGGRGRHSKSEDVERYRNIIELARNEPKLSRRELSRQLGCSRNTVDKALAIYANSKEDIELFRKRRADIFAEKQRTILNTLTGKKIEAMNPRDAIVGMGILYDKERLEMGESTSNVASLVKILRAADQIAKEEKVDAG